MGFESFRVELGGGPASFSQAEGAVRRLLHARPDRESIASRGSCYSTVDDGSHVIEVEVAEAPVRVSCRFTLSHPHSIGPAFLSLVRQLQVTLGMDARICDDTRPASNTSFPAARFPEFAQVVADAIAVRRAEWVAQFGGETFPATTAQVYAKFILPACVPVLG